MPGLLPMVSIFPFLFFFLRRNYIYESKIFSFLIFCKKYTKKRRFYWFFSTFLEQISNFRRKLRLRGISKHRRSEKRFRTGQSFHRRIRKNNKKLRVAKAQPYAKILVDPTYVGEEYKNLESGARSAPIFKDIDIPKAFEILNRGFFVQIPSNILVFKEVITMEEVCLKVDRWGRIWGNFARFSARSGEIWKSAELGGAEADEGREVPERARQCLRGVWEREPGARRAPRNDEEIVPAKNCWSLLSRSEEILPERFEALDLWGW